MQAMRDIAFVVYSGYSVMALAVVTAFEVANSLVPEPPARTMPLVITDGFHLRNYDARA